MSLEMSIVLQAVFNEAKETTFDFATVNHCIFFNSYFTNALSRQPLVPLHMYCMGQELCTYCLSTAKLCIAKDVKIVSAPFCMAQRQGVRLPYSGLTALDLVQFWLVLEACFIPLFITQQLCSVSSVLACRNEILFNDTTCYPIM